MSDIEKTEIWLLPESETIYVTEPFGVPAEACDWPEYVVNRLKGLLGDEYFGALLVFDGKDSWNQACVRAEQLKQQLHWSIDYYNRYSVSEEEE